MKTFFNIALSGLSEADARKVLQTLESPELGNWSLSEGGTSDLLVIDVDSVWGHMDWLRAVADGRRCAAYTEQESMRDCDLLLRKPLDTRALIEVLRVVQGGPQGPRAKPAGPKATQAAPAPAAKPAVVSPPRAAAAAPSPVTSPAAVPPVAQTKPVAPEAPASAPAPASAEPPKAAEPAALPASAKPAPPKAPEADHAPAPAPAAPGFDDAASSVGALLLAGGIDTQVLVKDGDGTTLFIDPSNNVYRAPPQLKPLEKLLAMPAARLVATGAGDPQVQHAGPEQPIVRLLWFAALSASDGRLAPHLDPSSTWKLTRWPQIEREFPRHFRIATAMMKQAATLEDVAEASKSPVEDVAGFINAYYVAGYVTAEGSDEPVDAANSTANVLSRLRRTFSRGTRQATS